MAEAPPPMAALPSLQPAPTTERTVPHAPVEVPRASASNGPEAPAMAAPVAKPVTVPRMAALATPDALGSRTPLAGVANTSKSAGADARVAVRTPAASNAVPASAPIGPARSVTRGRLVVVAKSGTDGASYPFGDTLDVGRSEGQIIVAEDPYLSPRHVRIAWTGTKLVLRDLSSTNGVYVRLIAARDMFAGKVNQRAAHDANAMPGEVAVPLQDQDLILIGQQVLRFESLKGGASGFGPTTEHGTLLFGSPAAPRYARLSQRTVEGVTRDVYYLRKSETVLGRESGDLVFTEDPFLSRRHASIRRIGATSGPPAPPGSTRAESAESAESAPRFALVDLGSSNGSFLRIRDEIELLPGDQFRVGQQLFRVDFENMPRTSQGGAG